MKSHLIIALKAIVTLGIIGIIARSVDVKALLATVRSLQFGYVIAATALIAIQNFILAGRWWVVLRSIGGRLNLGEVVQITLIAQFFNQALPSTVGGDAIRIWRAKKQGVPLRFAAQSVLVDRGLATAALLMILLCGVLGQSGLGNLFQVAMPVDVLAGCGVVGFAVLAFAGPVLFGLLPKHRVFTEIAGLATALHRVVLGAGSFSATTALSVVNHLTSIWTTVLLANAVGVDLPFSTAFVLAPIVLLLSMAPISIGGWGVREGLTVLAFSFANVAPTNSLAISLLFGILTIIGNLPGGVLWPASGAWRIDTTDLPADIARATEQGV